MVHRTTSMLNVIVPAIFFASLVATLCSAHPASAGSHALEHRDAATWMIWIPVYSCAVDIPSRVLTNVSTTVSPTNTPIECTDRCRAQGYGFAGVENGDECHCGSDLVRSALNSAPDTDCSTPCAGNATIKCGGPWRITVR